MTVFIVLEARAAHVVHGVREGPRIGPAELPGVEAGGHQPRLQLRRAVAIGPCQGRSLQPAWWTGGVDRTRSDPPVRLALTAREAAS